MEHKSAQRRFLVCAAFLCFGSLCGALTFYRISHLTAGQISDLVAAPFAKHPILLPLSVLLGPMLMMIIGYCHLGTFFIPCILSLLGFFMGFLEFLAIRIGFFPLMTSVSFLICSACYLKTGGSMMRLSMKMKNRILYSGLSNTDFSYDFRRIYCSLFILFLLSLAYSLFLLSM